MSATATTTLDWSQLHSLYQTVHDQHEHSCTVLARVQRDQRTNEPKWIVGLIAGGTDAEDKHYYSTEIEQEWLKKQVDVRPLTLSTSLKSSSADSGMRVLFHSLLNTSRVLPMCCIRLGTASRVENLL